MNPIGSDSADGIEKIELGAIFTERPRLREKESRPIFGESEQKSQVLRIRRPVTDFTKSLIFARGRSHSGFRRDRRGFAGGSGSGAGGGVGASAAGFFGLPTDGEGESSAGGSVKASHRTPSACDNARTVLQVGPLRSCSSSLIAPYFRPDLSASCCCVIPAATRSSFNLRPKKSASVLMEFSRKMRDITLTVCVISSSIPS